MTIFDRRTESTAFPATPTSVGEARHWLSKALAGHPRRDDAVLLLSEAVTNSLVHTDSTSIEVSVRIEVNGDVRIEVIDQGAQTTPALSSTGSDDEPATSGRGIRLVRTLSVRWGFTEEGSRCVLWFLLSARDCESGALKASVDQDDQPMQRSGNASGGR
ncbi:hypothetical protein Sme01_51580 [Sphaerisporangium melleum]|uniref:Histidine kinase/HSP90-like ATPase domain-containing protein n=1 Tax=Sphaerisporangium melleum TaxID=321316 RepID=A0A917QXF6_9ACTN|nr:ATP-binding protein [Sphaerisporangium melleum]GGK75890.1 hypothetical protein GCM10007964_18340 [Sphaerisporangium melleum]GII72682.1 hypothetical protein Sme01_51580 [Sphaerisporangium melleum]